MKIALFDADGTLYTAQFGRGLMRYAAEHGRKNRVRLYYASLLPYFLLAKIIPSSMEYIQRLVIVRLAWFLKGYDLQQAAAAFEWVVGEYLLPTYRPEILQRLRQHQAQGCRVVIVSGTFTPCLEMICSRLGVSDWVGTNIEFLQGRYTGRVLPPVIKGQDKVDQVCRYLTENKVQVDWDSSYAYGDSLSDQDMLKLVGYPTAVYPEPALRSLAQEQGWGILED